MASSTDVSELLLQWAEARHQGKLVSAEQLCATCPELLTELKERIEAVETMERRFGKSRADGAPDRVVTAAERDSNGHVSVPPLRVPGYEILGVLDQGGMGIVFKARQAGLKRIVALKMIRTETQARPQQLARFKVEAEAVAQLQHPNIVQIYDIGEADGRPYFTMEFIDGGSLSQKIGGRPLPPRQAAELLATLADAIHFAHQRGIVHRDLKPANVLLTANGDRPAATGQNSPAGDSASLAADGRQPIAAKITDFGLAKRLDSQAGPSIVGGQTQSGAVLGTPSYMAPEQAAGKTRDVGPAADIYALGAILYEMLTGRPPFAGVSAVDTLLQVMSKDPVPPSREQPKTPRDLETICLKCLEKAPTHRYASAADLAADLRRFLTGLPIQARSISLVRRAIKFSRRRPEASLLIAVLLLVGVGLGGRAAWLDYREQQETRATAARLAPQARAVLHQYCYSCHGQLGAPPEGELDVLNHALLVSPERGLVVPGKVEASRLIHRIKDNSMPPVEEEEYPRLSEDEIDILKKWVQGGAPAFPPAGPEDQPSADPPDPLAVAVKEIFKDRCAECHHFAKANKGITILNHDLLVSKRKVVIPGDPEQSILYKTFFLTDPKKVMPPSNDALPLTDEEKKTVYDWIAAGAPPFPRERRSK